MTTLDSLADDVKLADHCYQLAVANGDPIKIKQALHFWNQCDADFQAELRRLQRNAKARAKRAQASAANS